MIISSSAADQDKEVLIITYICNYTNNEYFHKLNDQKPTGSDDSSSLLTKQSFFLPFRWPFPLEGVCVIPVFK